MPRYEMRHQQDDETADTAQTDADAGETTQEALTGEGAVMSAEDAAMVAAAGTPSQPALTGVVGMPGQPEPDPVFGAVDSANRVTPIPQTAFAPITPPEPANPGPTDNCGSAGADPAGPAGSGA